MGSKNLWRRRAIYHYIACHAFEGVILYYLAKKKKASKKSLEFEALWAFQKGRPYLPLHSILEIERCPVSFVE